MSAGHDTSHLDYSLLVLCGGAGSRMAGQDKPLLQWRGRCMVDAVLDSVGDEIPKLISANRNLEAYARRGQVVTDQTAPIQVASPLTGILAGLQVCATEWLLITPGDTPNLPSDWHHGLIQRATLQPNLDAVVCHDGQRQQHLHVLMKQLLVGRLERFLRGGQYAAKHWLAELNVAQVQTSSTDAFLNVNEPCDLG